MKNISKLKDHIGFWMSRISQEVHYSFEAKIKKLEITIPEWCVLISLYHEKQTSPAKIASIVGIDRGAISRTVEKLVKRGFIQREEGSDRRFTLLLLTPKAEELVPKLAALADKNDSEFFSILDKDEKDQLTKILLKLAKQLDM